MDELNTLISSILSKKVQEKLTTDIWESKTVSPEVFHTDWLPPKLSEPQLAVFNALFGVDGKKWSKEYLEYLLYWGEGCLEENTILKDEETGKEYTVKELADRKQSITVKSLKIENKNEVIITYNGKKKKRRVKKYKIVKKKTGIPYKKGKAELYKVRTKSGKEIIVSAEHKFYTKDGWKTLGELKKGNKIAINFAPIDSMTKQAKIKRNNSISKNTVGVKKSELHRKNIKNSINIGRFKKGQSPWNTGKHLAQETIDKIKKTLAGRPFKNRATPGKHMKNHKKNCSCMFCITMRKGAHHFWHRVKYKNISMRSSWEKKYAKYLDNKNISWEYEPRFFDLGRMGNYFPDFYLPNTKEYIEIKGLGNVDKVEQFRKLYPNKRITVLRRHDLELLGIKL